MHPGVVGKAKDITLDLGGHTVIYNNKQMEISGKWTVYRAKAAFGVKAKVVTSLKIFNGRIKQGAGNNAAATASIGFNPVYASNVEDGEIAGITSEHSGAQISGIYLHYCKKVDVHHNVVLGHATKILDRHYGCSAIMGGNYKYHHNLVKRTIHRGLSMGGAGEIYNNEIYMDSYASNAFAVTASKAYENRIFGTGFYVTGIGYGNVSHDNLIHLEAQTDMRKRWAGSEKGRTASLNGFRITQYIGNKTVRENTLYHDNVVIIKGRDDVVCRGTQFFSDPYLKNTVFRNNIVKVLSMDEKTNRVCCVVTEGLAKREGEQLPVYYKDNTFISNYSNICFGNYYGQGSNHHFYNNKLVRIGDDKRYKTFICDHEYNPSKNHVFRDCELEGGADFDSVHWGKAGEKRDFTVQWTLTLKTAPGAKVSITDKTGKEVFAGNANAKGAVSAPLSQYMAKQAGKTYFTPHKITVEKDGRKSEKKVTMDKKQNVEINL